MCILPFKVETFNEFIGTLRAGYHLMLCIKDENNAIPQISGLIAPAQDSVIGVVVGQPKIPNMTKEIFENMCIVGIPTDDTPVIVYNMDDDATLTQVYDVLSYDFVIYAIYKTELTPK